MEFGEKLREIRKRRNLTILDLAEKSGVSKSAISSYENGTVVPSALAALNLSKALKVDFDVFINDGETLDKSNFVYGILKRELADFDFSKLDYMQLKNFEYDLDLLLSFVLEKYKLKD